MLPSQWLCDNKWQSFVEYFNLIYYQDKNVSVLIFWDWITVYVRHSLCNINNSLYEWESTTSATHFVDN